MNKNIKDCDQDFNTKLVYAKNTISWLWNLIFSNCLLNLRFRVIYLLFQLLHSLQKSMFFSKEQANHWIKSLKMYNTCMNTNVSVSICKK